MPRHNLSPADEKRLADWGKHVLRPAREARDLTRRQLAAMTGIAESTLRNIEAGFHSPCARILRQVCPALNLVNPLPLRDCLTVEIGPMQPHRALDLMAAALREFVAKRELQTADRPRGLDPAVVDMEQHADREDARELLAAINTERTRRR